MCPGKITRQSQPQTGACNILIARLVETLKWAKGKLALLRRDARAIIVDDYHAGMRAFFCRNGDPPSSLYPSRGL